MEVKDQKDRLAGKSGAAITNVNTRAKIKELSFVHGWESHILS